MLRGFSTVSFFADDMEAAIRWYTELLGVEPYFNVPGEDGSVAYTEFRSGDYLYELGIINNKYAPHSPAAGPAGSVVFWHVDDVEAALEKLLSMGAKEHDPLTRRTAGSVTASVVEPGCTVGFVTASVVDPFGNILGVMYNPHYLEILASTKKA